LRGSAGITPASLFSPQGKNAQTEGHFKERKKGTKNIGLRNLLAASPVSQIATT
jgi:hypothetical protein